MAIQGGKRCSDPLAVVDEARYADLAKRRSTTCPGRQPTPCVPRHRRLRRRTAVPRPPQADHRRQPAAASWARWLVLMNTGFIKPQFAEVKRRGVEGRDARQRVPRPARCPAPRTAPHHHLGVDEGAGTAQRARQTLDEMVAANSTELVPPPSKPGGHPHQRHHRLPKGARATPCRRSPGAAG